MGGGDKCGALCYPPRKGLQTGLSCVGDYRHLGHSCADRLSERFCSGFRQATGDRETDRTRVTKHRSGLSWHCQSACEGETGDP